MVVFQVLFDVQDKVMVILECENLPLKCLAYINYCANIIILGVVFLNIGTLDTTIKRLTFFCGFVGLINFDNAIGAVLIKFYFEEH